MPNLKTPQFVHLHVHSHYSLLDGLAKIDQLIVRAKELGMDSVALTDHGVMYGALEFYQKAKEAGIKPIIGCEVYISPRKMTDKTPRIDTSPFHLVLLAKDLIGYQNLLKIVTIAHLNGYYYKPRIDKKHLKKYSQGLIALSACLQGEVAKAIVNQNPKIEQIILEYQEIFGPENFYLEVQNKPNIPEQKIVNQKIFELAAKLKAPVVATCDVHYLTMADRQAHEVLLCVQTGKYLSDENRLSMKNEDFSLKSPVEMAQYFASHPEVLENTVKISQRCNVELKLGENIMPKFTPPVNITEHDLLRKLCYIGLLKRYGEYQPEDEKLANEIFDHKFFLNRGVGQDKIDRLLMELSIIEKMHFESYFLIVADFVNYAKKQGIMVGPGRGSAAGSIVSYALNITNLDPLKHQLLFERFLNPERISMPDIDLDFADSRRSEVIEYVVGKYGEDKVAQIITFGTMAARNAVRDTGRVLGMSYSEVDVVAKLIPQFMDLAKALAESPELKAKYDNEPAVKKLIDLAKRIEGVVRHASTHAAGVVISDQPLVNYVPIQRATKGDISKVTQYTMRDLEAAGLLKMDFLGLSNLTIIERAIKIIEKTTDQKIDINRIPFNDQKTYELLARGETVGVFQFESEGMKRYLKELKPNKLDDLIAMAALYRPGPIELIPEYIAAKQGLKEIKYIHPALKPILEETYGIIVYQEQVQRVAQDLAGFTLGEGYLLIKAVAKKIKKLLQEQKEKFINGAIKNGVDETTAKQVWGIIEPFARYGFNKSHSACYAYIAYQTAYLKANFPSQFMAALLTSDQHNIDRVAIEIAECQRMGIKILPPDVNESFAGFAVMKNKDIRFGMMAIKNVGEGAIEAIVSERKKNGKYQNLEDFLKRVFYREINKKVLESLIKCGAMESFGERAELAANVETMIRYAGDLQKQRLSGQTDLFAGVADNHIDHLKLAPTEPMSSRDKIILEKQLLGIYVSRHPMADYRKFIKTYLLPIGELSKEHRQQKLTIAGVITTIKKFTTKNNETMMFVKIEDTTGNLEVLVFPKLLKKKPEIWQEENILILSGNLSDKDQDFKFLANDAKELTPRIVKNYQKKQPAVSKIATQSIRLFIPKSGDKNLLLKIKEIINQHLGGADVWLFLPNDQQIQGYQQVKIKDKLDLNEEAVSKLRALLSFERVKVVPASLEKNWQRSMVA